MTGLPIEKKINTKHGIISYYQQNGKPNYIFIHGLGGQKELFSGLFKIPTTHEKGIICIDLLGYGKSSRIVDNLKYSFNLQAEAIKEMLLSLRLEKNNIVLHSMSSALLPQLLKFKDIEISQIFLLEGNLIEEDADWSHSISVMSDLKYKTYFEKLQKYSHIILGQQLQRSYSEEEIKRWSKCFINTDYRALRETSQELYNITIRGDIIDTLRNFPGRIVYFRGINNRNWQGYKVLEKLGIEVIKVENAGHFLMLDKPEYVYSKIFEGENSSRAESIEGVSI